jgi:hypothetical protein
MPGVHPVARESGFHCMSSVVASRSFLGMPSASTLTRRPAPGILLCRIRRAECVSLEKSQNPKTIRYERRSLRRGNLVDTFKRNAGSSFFKSSFAGNKSMTSTPRTLARNSNSPRFSSTSMSRIFTRSSLPATLTRSTAWLKPKCSPKPSSFLRGNSRRISSARYRKRRASPPALHPTLREQVELRRAKQHKPAPDNLAPETPESRT